MTKRLWSNCCPGDVLINARPLNIDKSGGFRVIIAVTFDVVTIMDDKLEIREVFMKNFHNGYHQWDLCLNVSDGTLDDLRKL